MSKKEAEINKLRQKLSQNEQKEELAGVSRRKLADSCFQAVRACRFNKVKFLLDNGVSPAVKNDKGQNLLVAALYAQDEEKRRRMVRYLLYRGAPCEGLDHQQRDVLTWACLLGRPTQVQQILDAAMGNINLHRQDADGMTPLHHATRNGHLDVVRILIRIMNKFRLSVDVCDAHGLTPYIYARRLGLHDVALLLVEQGNASTKQFDSQNFLSAEQWAIIGAKERRVQIKQAKDQEMALYKIRGRLPPIDPTASSSSIPKISLSGDNSTELATTTVESRSSLLSTIQTHATSQASTHPNNLTSSQASSHPNRSVTKITVIKRQKKKKRKTSPGEDDSDMPDTARSVDTAVTLLNLGSKLNPVHGYHPTNFVNSSRISDDDGSPELGQRVHRSRNAIPSIMDILTQQSTTSFCKPAKMPDIIQKVPDKKGKGRLSTLAIVLQNKNKGSSSSMSNGSSQKKMTMGQVAHSLNA